MDVAGQDVVLAPDHARGLDLLLHEHGDSLHDHRAAGLEEEVESGVRGAGAHAHAVDGPDGSALLHGVDQGSLELVEPLDAARQRLLDLAGLAHLAAELLSKPPGGATVHGTVDGRLGHGPRAGNPSGLDVLGVHRVDVCAVILVATKHRLPQSPTVPLAHVVRQGHELQRRGVKARLDVPTARDEEGADLVAIRGPGGADVAQVGAAVSTTARLGPDVDRAATEDPRGVHELHVGALALAQGPEAGLDDVVLGHGLDLVVTVGQVHEDLLVHDGVALA